MRFVGVAVALPPQETATRGGSTTATPTYQSTPDRALGNIPRQSLRYCLTIERIVQQALRGGVAVSILGAQRDTGFVLANHVRNAHQATDTFPFFHNRLFPWGGRKGDRRAYLGNHGLSGAFLGRCGARSVDSKATKNGTGPILARWEAFVWHRSESSGVERTVQLPFFSTSRHYAKTTDSRPSRRIPAIRNPSAAKRLAEKAVLKPAAPSGIYICTLIRRDARRNPRTPPAAIVH
jgi:hypothetical protein